MVESVTEGKTSLHAEGSISAFNKLVSENFLNLSTEEQNRLADLAKEAAVDENLTDQEINNKISKVFCKLRDQTASNIYIYIYN